MKGSNAGRREPIPGLGYQAARAVRAQERYRHPTEIEIEVLAYLRGVIVRGTPTTGARANLVRLGNKGIVSVAASLSPAERRWAIAHELGHFEAHASVSYLGLCTGQDMLLDYLGSGREQEANAFAAELLMPQDLFERACDLAKVTWEPLLKLADEYQVSATAAVLRFLAFTDERVAVVAAKDGKVIWRQATRSFGPWPTKAVPLNKDSLAHDYFAKGKVWDFPQTVNAEAWVENPRGDSEVIEHVLVVPRYNSTLSLLWYPVRRP